MIYIVCAHDMFSFFVDIFRFQTKITAFFFKAKKETFELISINSI